MMNIVCCSADILTIINSGFTAFSCWESPSAVCWSLPPRCLLNNALFWCFYSGWRRKGIGEQGGKLEVTRELTRDKNIFRISHCTGKRVGRSLSSVRHYYRKWTKIFTLCIDRTCRIFIYCIIVVPIKAWR